MNLRDYQEAAVTSACSHLAKGVNPLVIAPTGAGKTVIASEIMRRWQVANPGKPCYFVAHRMELLDQAERTMQKFGVVGKVLSVFNREFAGITADERRTALVVFDEAHHAVASSWARFSETFTGPKVAVTATPDRMDRQKLEAVGFDPCYEIAIRTLIEQGHLVRPLAYKMPVELSGILMRGYDEPMEAIADSIVEEMKRWDRKKAIAFLPDVESSEKLVGLLNQRGCRSAHVDGSTHDYMRSHAIESYKTGELKVLCNVNLFTEGFDAPETDCVILLRPTQSRALWVQMIGRGLRTAPGKADCLILDPMWVSGENAFQPADAFTVFPGAKAGVKEGGCCPMDVAEVCDRDAEQKMIDRIAKEERRQQAKDAREKGFIDLSVACACFGFILPPAGKDEAPMTSGQKAELERFKVYAVEVTGSQASWMIGRLQARERLGLATVKQVRKLRQFGVGGALKMTVAQASARIGTDWRMAGKKPFTIRR
jgi:hypothetical protein